MKTLVFTFEIIIQCLGKYIHCHDIHVITWPPTFWLQNWPYTQCDLTPSVTLHPVCPYTQCVLTSSVSLHPVCPYTQCVLTPSVSLHPVCPYIQCVLTSSVSLHPVPNNFLVNGKYNSWLCTMDEVILCHQWDVCFREVTIEWLNWHYLAISCHSLCSNTTKQCTHFITTLDK